MKFITLNTFTRTSMHNKEPRGVTLAYSERDNKVTLLGNLEHSTELVIDQELVNQLQDLVNLLNQNK